MTKAPRPYFEALQELLEREGSVTLGQLTEHAGEQSYGMLVLMLSLPSLIPGVNVVGAPVGGTAIIALGWQMIRGVPHPSIPERLRRQPLHKGRLKEALASLERQLDRLRGRNALRRPLNPRWTGLLLAWTGLLLAVPVPLPMGNILPAAALGVLGAALLEERPAWFWLGLLASLGITLYFGLSFKLILKEVHRIGHWVAARF